jgi:hypothetical protein
VLAVFFGTFFLFTIFGIIFRKSEDVASFDIALPTINVFWAFSIAYVVVNAGGNGTRLLGAIGAVVAVALLAASFWLAQRAEDGAPGVGAFTLASGVLLALALPAATEKLIYSLPIISLVGIFMAVMSRSWKNGTVRLTTYVFHIYCTIALAFVLKGNAPTALDAVNIIPAGLLALITLYQYQWCRWCPPEPGYTFFDRFDHHDRNATVLLVAGLASGFFMMRCAIFQTLQAISVTLPPDAFRCAQSVLVNGAAIALIVLAFMRSSREIRNIAFLVTIAGGIKVFAYDLLGTHGLPLVLSVLSFGIAVAVESVALGKWPRKAGEHTVPKEMQEVVL